MQQHLPAVHITDLEAAINYWRSKDPEQQGTALSAQTGALAEVYARLAYEKKSEALWEEMPENAQAAWLEWYATTPNSPCIAICSTSQGDSTCKGCGRTFEELARWQEMNPLEKRAVWRRIQEDGSAWRFNRYAERALERN